MCKGDDLEDRLLMPKMSLIGDVVNRRKSSKRENTSDFNSFQSSNVPSKTDEQLEFHKKLQ